MCNPVLNLVIMHDLIEFVRKYFVVVDALFVVAPIVFEV